MADLPATQANRMALADERTLMRQGHTFLDEKRVLLATETMRRLRAHQAEEAALVEALQAAAAALRAALQRHGRSGLAAQPVASPAVAPGLQAARFLGVTVLEVAPAERPDDEARVPATTAADPSPDAEACRAAFAALLAPLAALAVSAGNLERLASEYRRTERRALALENVLLPEVAQALGRIDEQLTLTDQEEAVRIRQAARTQTGSITQMG
ncbi:V-type ATP synthase subunit D [Rubrivivax albus]|nr:V-type ATP synthase subunit D [Rubrivivax albus]